MARAEAGDKVVVHYTGSLEDGTIFGFSYENEPLELTIGEKRILPSFENALVGIKKGDTKTVSIHPEEAFGHRREDLIFDIERSRIPTGIDLRLGGVLRVDLDTGKNFDAIIANIDDEIVTLDGNHPLAEKVLNLEIHLVEIL